MRKSVKFYNVLFPVWFLLIFPVSWLVVLPVNFAIDSAVLLLSAKHLKVEDLKTVYKKSILKIWLFGFAADIAGALLLLLSQANLGDFWYEHITTPAAMNPFSDLLGCIFCIVCVAVSGLLIYVFNLNITLRKTGLDEKKKKFIALMMAVCTAPYVYLLPSMWMW